MIPTIRAEFRKLLTVRSTYVVSTLTLLLIGLFSFFAAYNAVHHPDPSGPPSGFATNALEGAALNAVMLTGTFVAIVAIMLICYEYRYNTIAYSLTISNSRMKVLLAKLKVVSVYAIVMALLGIAMAMAFSKIGAAVGGGSLGPQHVEVWSLLWRSLVFVIGSAWLGLILGFLTRSLVIAITIYFVIPAIEPLLHNILKINQNYLLSASQTNIVQTGPQPEWFTAIQSLGVFAIYLAIGLIVASILFTRRDAMN
jgi:ABC-2 type transport system permease protein